MEKQFHLVLYEPVIPQNTGSIARLCACTGATLHLIHPLGFHTDAASVRRAGLDYWEHVDIREHQSWDLFLTTENPKNISFLSKFAQRPYTEISYEDEGAIYLVLGSETKGLPETLRELYPDAFFGIPMRTHLVRSLNLSQAAAIVLYEGLRRADFPNVHADRSVHFGKRAESADPCN